MAFVPVLAASLLPPGRMAGVRVGELKVLLVNIAGVVYAYEDRCAHQQVELSDGQLEGTILTCWAHQWQYDVVRGVGVNPEPVAMRRFAARVEGGQVLVDVTAGGAAGGS